MIPFQEAATLTRTDTITALTTSGRSRLRPSREAASRRDETAIELIRTLAQSFPTIARMLGEEAFFEVAAEFVAQHSPIAPASTARWMPTAIS